MSGILCFLLIGCFIGIIFTLLLVNFDSKWKLLLESAFGLGGSGISITYLFKLFKISNQIQMFNTTIFFIIGFIVTTILSLMIMCHLIKDKDDADVLRIRDILLGQKSYINKYYQQRMDEIDKKLGIPILEARERNISEREHILEEQEKHILDEQQKIDLLGQKKLKLELPEKANIILTKDYINVMPSYIRDIFHCINNINDFTKLFLSELSEKQPIDMTKLKSFFISIALYISNEIFGGNPYDVRVHFRYYNKSKHGYEKLIAIMGDKILSKEMTFIPYDDDSMIKKSYECKRALIKSINVTHDYKSNNNTTWQDYMTYTFYNLKTDDKPYLSFGISVKNSERYKKLFYFINFFMLENYLQDNIEQLNEYVNIEEIIYGGER